MKLPVFPGCQAVTHPIGIEARRVVQTAGIPASSGVESVQEHREACLPELCVTPGLTKGSPLNDPISDGIKSLDATEKPTKRRYSGEYEIELRGQPSQIWFCVRGNSTIRSVSDSTLFSCQQPEIKGGSRGRHFDDAWSIFSMGDVRQIFLVFIGRFGIKTYRRHPQKFSIHLLLNFFHKGRVRARSAFTNNDMPFGDWKAIFMSHFNALIDFVMKKPGHSEVVFPHEDISLAFRCERLHFACDDAEVATVLIPPDDVVDRRKRAFVRSALNRTVRHTWLKIFEERSELVPAQSPERLLDYTHACPASAVAQIMRPGVF
jgi:hypothetical protein